MTYRPWRDAAAAGCLAPFCAANGRIRLLAAAGRSPINTTARATANGTIFETCRPKATRLTFWQRWQCSRGNCQRMRKCLLGPHRTARADRFRSDALANGVSVGVFMPTGFRATHCHRNTKTLRFDNADPPDWQSAPMFWIPRGRQTPYRDWAGAESAWPQGCGNSSHSGRAASE